MIIAIKLEVAMTEDGVPEKGYVVYTSQVATFEHDGTALDLMGKMDDIMLIDTVTHRVLKDARVSVGGEE